LRRLAHCFCTSCSWWCSGTTFQHFRIVSIQRFLVDIKECKKIIKLENSLFCCLLADKLSSNSMFVADLNSFRRENPVKFASLWSSCAWFLLTSSTVLRCVFHIYIFSSPFLGLSSYLGNSLCAHEVFF
jgi:hypothetical protein